MNDAERARILERCRDHAARFDEVARSRQGRGLAATATVPLGRNHEPPTARQLEVLQLIADGLSNEEIAVRLTLSVETIKSHVRQILGRLAARSRAHAVALGIRSGLVA
jgi:DNA-binding NarL/FixJ family response regulator